MPAMFRYVEFGSIELHQQIAPPSVEGIQAHVDFLSERMRSRLRRQSPKVYTIQDNSGHPPAGAAERKVLSDWMARDFELIRSGTLGVGFVIQSAMVRGALTAVFWLSKLPAPYRVHGTLDEALRVAMEQVEAEGLTVAPELKGAGVSKLVAGR